MKMDFTDYARRNTDHADALHRHNEQAAAKELAKMEAYWMAIGRNHIADTWTDPALDMQEQYDTPDNEVVNARDGSPCYQPEPLGIYYTPNSIMAVINERDQIRILTADEQDDDYRGGGAIAWGMVLMALAVLISVWGFVDWLHRMGH